ncbi:12307_t:CDS:2 [Gigaspora margarita]|uniref:12307_t:CDS:1 n=1 Tax=Gigaspora margarita TaxID=4874 RepID=A0ABN7UGZ0_GIGMA|nr:12307_t:CDS:2 [Gigaspora margarita]
MNSFLKPTKCCYCIPLRAAITILLDICGIIAYVLFYNHDVLAWIVSTLVDIIIAIHFALVISAYAAGESSKGSDNSTYKSSGV